MTSQDLHLEINEGGVGAYHSTNEANFCATKKFGIKISRTVAEATQFDNENSNKLWTDAIRKEMTHVILAFEEALCSIEEGLSGKGLPC